MKNILLIVLLNLSAIAIIHARDVGRAPAVEPFVEIPREALKLNQELGKKAAYRFMNFATKSNKTATRPTSMSLSVLVSLLFFLSLPFALWNMMMDKIEKSEFKEKLEHEAILAQYQNVTPISKAKNKKAGNSQTKEETYKKAA